MIYSLPSDSKENFLLILEKAELSIQEYNFFQKIL